jgi:hypothetical protein
LDARAGDHGAAVAARQVLQAAVDDRAIGLTAGVHEQFVAGIHRRRAGDAARRNDFDAAVDHRAGGHAAGQHVEEVSEAADQRADRRRAAADVKQACAGQGHA